MNYYFIFFVCFFLRGFYETHFNMQWTIFSREFLVFNHWHKGFDNVVSEQTAVTFTENKFYANLQRDPKESGGFGVLLPDRAHLIHY